MLRMASEPKARNTWTNQLAMISRLVAMHLRLSLILAARDQVRHLVAVVFRRCEQIVFVIDAHVFSHQIEGNQFLIAETSGPHPIEANAQFMNEISRKNLAYIKNFDEICIQVVHTVI